MNHVVTTTLGDQTVTFAPLSLTRIRRLRQSMKTMDELRTQQKYDEASELMYTVVDQIYEGSVSKSGSTLSKDDFLDLVTMLNYHEMLNACLRASYPVDEAPLTGEPQPVPVSLKN